MTAIITRCRICGAAFEPAHDAIVAGSWRTCPACRPPLAEPHQCRECGRPLRLTSRRVCLHCMGATA